MKTLKATVGFLLSFFVVLFLLRFHQSANYPATLYLVLFAVLLIFGSIAVLRKIGAAWIIVGITLGVMLAFQTAERNVHIQTPSDIESFADNGSHTLHGWIIDDPDVRPTQTRLTVAVDTIDGTTNVRGRILVTEYGGYPPHHYGDEVEVSGKLRRPEIIEDFDYPHYLELSGIRALVSRGSVRSVTTGAVRPPAARTYRVIGLLYDLRKMIEDRIGVILPEPHGSLLAGLITGSRRGLPQHLSDDFRTSGITHIIAVSGYNITIILALLSSALFWLPVKRRFWPLVIMVTAFTIFVGAGAPVVRAAIMGIIGLIALRAERIAVPRLTILWTGLFMILWNPLQLWYDASFQLSFLAVIGITELSAPLKKILKRVPEVFAMRESLVATIAAQVGTLPISILLFHQFSLVSPIVNVLVAPLVPLAMLTGTLSVMASVLWMPIGLLLGYVTWAILHVIMLIAHIGAMVPFAAIRW